MNLRGRQNKFFKTANLLLLSGIVGWGLFAYFQDPRAAGKSRASPANPLNTHMAMPADLSTKVSAGPDKNADGFWRAPPSYARYQAAFARRDIFQILEARPMVAGQKPARPKALPEAQPKAAPQERFADIAQRYQLLGVLIDDAPCAFIYDRRANETLIVSAGQKVGPAVLARVGEGKVVLRYQGKEGVLEK